MKYLLLSFISLVFICTATAQEWSEPVNVSNMEGTDYYPDFCIDGNGVIHCVWSHLYYGGELIKVFYSKSVDEGATWSDPEDVSQNSSLWCQRPHIVTDSQNQLFVTYDYDAYSSTQSLIVLKSYDGYAWSEIDTVSVGMPGAFRNTLNIDNNDRVYCFWYLGINSGYFSCRFFDNDAWSEIISPYNGDYHILIEETVIDSDNKVHCLGNMFNEWSYDETATYFFYEPSVNEWSEVEELNKKSYDMDAGIDLDDQNNPHIVWRQNRYLSGPNNDSTLYKYFNGTTWSEPELIVEDPYSQMCQVVNNNVYILDLEKGDPLNNVVIYEKDDTENWIGEIVISAEIIDPERLISFDTKHHLLLYGQIDNDNYEIYYMDKLIDTTTYISNKDNFSIDLLNVYPNPFSEHTQISFNLNKPGISDVSIFDLSGNRIVTLMNKKNIPGKYQVVWDGKNEDGKEVCRGLYLIRLHHGKNIITRSVENIR